MTPHHGHVRSSTNDSAMSGYSGYSSGSEDFNSRMLALTRKRNSTNQIDNATSPLTPPPGMLLEEYMEGARAANGHLSSVDEQDIRIPITSVDPMGMHLLLETAMADSRDFNVLSPDDLEYLKREELRISRMIDAGKKKLYIESKVDNTQRLLQRLGPSGRKATPPGAPLAPKRSLLRFRTSNTDLRNDETPAEATSARCEELAKQLWRLEKRREELHKRRLEHTAGVLQMNNQIQEQNKQYQVDSRYSTWNSPDENACPQTLNTIRDYPKHQFGNRLRLINTTLHSMVNETGIDNSANNSPPPAGDDPGSQMAYLEKALTSVNSHHQQLLEFLHSQRATMNDQADESQQSHQALVNLWDRLNSRVGETSLGGPKPDKPFSAQVFSDMVHRLCNHVAANSQEHQQMKEQLLKEQADRRDLTDTHTAERIRLIEQARDIHQQWQNGLKDLGHSQTQLGDTKTLLEQAWQEVENMKQQHENVLAEQLKQERNERKLREHDLSYRLAAKVSETSILRNALGEQESKLGAMKASEAASATQLQEAGAAQEALGASLLAAENHLAKRQEAAVDTSKSMKEFRLEKESLEVEIVVLQAELSKASSNLLIAEERATAYEKTAQDKTELASAKHILEIEVRRLTDELATITSALGTTQDRATKHESLACEHSERALTLLKEKQDLEAEMGRLNEGFVSLRNNLQDELNAKHQALAESNTKHQDLQEQARDLTNRYGNLESDLVLKSRTLADLTDKHNDLSCQLELQHSRAGDASPQHTQTSARLRAAPRDQNNSENRAKVLQKELQDLTADYEQLVQLEVESERERQTMEETVDAMRARIEDLELKASEAKVRALGKRTNSTTNEGVNGNGIGHAKRESAESISTAVMRNEFKKMMREARADYVKVIKEEQEERRRLESVIRTLRMDAVQSRFNDRALHSKRNNEGHEQNGQHGGLEPVVNEV